MILVELVGNDEMLRMAFFIRQKVFVEEQNVDPQIEYDEFEKVSHHFLAFHENNPVGTSRWRYTDKGIKLERFAVLANHRNMGVGKALLKATLKNIGNPEGRLIYLHSQNQAILFYRKFGFEISGDEFEEAGILHHEMIIKLKD